MMNNDMDDLPSRIVYEYPRELGGGTDNFSRWGEPCTPLHTCKPSPRLALPPLDIGPSAFSSTTLLLGGEVCCHPACESDDAPSNDSLPRSISSSDKGLSMSNASSGSSTRGSPYDAVNAFLPLPECRVVPRRRVLVLGCYTLSGVHIVQELLSKGFDVRVPMWDFPIPTVSARLEALLHDRTTSAQLSVVHAKDMQMAMRDCQHVIYNVTAVQPFRSTVQARSRYLEQVRELFCTAKDISTIQRIVVVVPASSVYPVETSMNLDERLCYDGMSVIASESERLASWAGIALTVVLPTAVIGPPLCGVQNEFCSFFGRFAQSSRLHRLMHNSHLNIVSAADVARCCARALLTADCSQKEVETFLLNAGEVSLTDLAHSIRTNFPALQPAAMMCTIPAVISRAYLRLRLSLSISFRRPASEIAHWHFLCCVRRKGALEDGQECLPPSFAVTESAPATVLNALTAVLSSTHSCAGGSSSAATFKTLALTAGVLASMYYFIRRR